MPCQIWLGARKHNKIGEMEKAAIGFSTIDDMETPTDWNLAIIISHTPVDIRGSSYAEVSVLLSSTCFIFAELSTQGGDRGNKYSDTLSRILKSVKTKSTKKYSYKQVEGKKTTKAEYV